MTEDAQGRQRKWRKLWLALASLAAVLAVLLVPPLVSLSRYKSQITHLMSASLGRPVRLASVELRLLPRPGFVLYDLSVEEDPAYGAEPVLHANTVTASFRLLSLWRGRLEISRISLDEASLNLVRTGAGRWNLDPLFRTAAARAGGTEGAAQAPKPLPLPYLTATNSRINIKNGAEKLPFSLVDTDLSFWQEKPGDWRVRLRGQPARTDLSLDLPDTGVVRLEASMHRAPELRQMPVHLDLEWREAQLGQLMRLVIGSDPGWRGDLTGELHLDGTADAAQVKTRLRATGVHRAEFAPAAPMDFDANCGFLYHFSGRSLEHLACDSPLGDGRIHLAGEMPGEGGTSRFSVELDRIPVAAGLDALRTVRSGFGPGLEAKGAISGKMTYAGDAPQSDVREKPAREGLRRPEKARQAVPGPLTGTLTVEGFQLSGDGLKEPIKIPKLALEPAAGAEGEPQALAATASIPAGGASPLTFTSRVALSGYRLTVRGQASVARARELAHAAGMSNAGALDALAGDPVTVDLSAAGPWLPGQRVPFSGVPAPSAPMAPPASAEAGTDRLSGTLTLHNANWKAEYLANHVEIAQATLHLDDGASRWDPVVFSYGPVKGTASLEIPAGCAAPCVPTFQVQFGVLDASALQAAILGAHEPGTVLSGLIDRLRRANPSSAPAWPQLEGAVKADSLVLGPVTLHEATVALRILSTGAEIASLDAGLLGGRLHGTGSLSTPGAGQDKPAYTLEGQFEKLSPAAVGQLLGQRWSGGAFNANGKIALSGFTGKELAASAKGTLHFEWRHGSVAGEGAAAKIPPALARFDRWTAEAEILDGGLALKQNQVQRGVRKSAVEAAATLAEPARVTFAAPQEAVAKKR